MQILFKAIAVIGMSLSFSTNDVPKENPCNIMYPRIGTENWGAGIYHIPDNASVTLYKDTKGSKFGKLSRKKDYFQFYDKSNRRRSLAYGDIEYIGHYAMSFLKVKESKENNYLKVFWNSFDDGLYVLKSDLVRAKAKFYTYKNLLYNINVPIDIEEYRNWASIGVNLKGNCLNLRSGASTKDNIIKCVKANREDGKEFSHISILEQKNKWAKVEVVTYVMSNDAVSECDYNEHEKNVGWIKALDDNGFPNIWYSVMNY